MKTLIIPSKSNRFRMSIFVRMQYFHGISEIHENHWKSAKSHKFTRTADFHANVGFMLNRTSKTSLGAYAYVGFPCPWGRRRAFHLELWIFTIYWYFIHFYEIIDFYIKPLKSLRDWYIARASVVIAIKPMECYGVLDVVQPKDLYFMKIQHFMEFTNFISFSGFHEIYQHSINPNALLTLAAQRNL